MITIHPTAAAVKPYDLADVAPAVIARTVRNDSMPTPLAVLDDTRPYDSAFDAEPTDAEWDAMYAAAYGDDPRYHVEYRGAWGAYDDRAAELG